MNARLLAAVLGAALFTAALSAVTAQHRARGLFVDLERAQQQARDLEAEASRLRVELGRATQPAAISGGARALGLQPLDPKRIVFLPAPAGAAASETGGGP